MRMDARPPRSPVAALFAAWLVLLVFTAPAAADPPIPGTVTITGRQMAGSLLTVDDTTPSGTYVAGYTWQVCTDTLGTNCTEVQNSTSSQYRSLASQDGKYVRVDATYMDVFSPYGTSSTTSAYFGPLAVHDSTIDVGPTGDFTTIQAAIDDASNGDTINIAAGTYNESLSVPGSFPWQATNLTIAGAGRSSTHITGSSPNIIAYAGSGPINLSGVDLTSRLQVYESSGTFSHLSAKTISASASNPTYQTVTFDDIDLPAFDGNGVTFNGDHLTATLKNSTLTASSSASRAVVIGDVASATVQDSTIDMSASSGGGWGVQTASPADLTVDGTTITAAGTGIQAQATGTLHLAGNTITGSQSTGIRVDYPSATPYITGNVVHDGTVGIQTTVGGYITGNDIRDASQTGIYVYGVAAPVIQGNAIVGNGTNFGPTDPDGGVTNGTGAPLTVEDNWWGCNGGPGTAGCDRAQGFGGGTVDADPWLVQTVTATPTVIGSGANTTVTTDFLHDSNGNSALLYGGLLPDLPVAFASTLGTPASASITAVDGTVDQQLTAPSGPGGTADVTATTDNQTTHASVAMGVPVLTWTTSPNLAYTERAAATAIDPSSTLVVTDVDDDLVGATVAVGAGHGTGDTLTADTSGTSITANFNAATWTLTLSGSDTAAHYQQVLRTVKFANNLHNPSGAQRTITVTVTDSTGDSASRSRLLDFTTVNEAPVVTTTSGNAQGPGVVDGGLTVSDVDSANLSGASVTTTAGTLDTTSVPTTSASVASYQAGLRGVTISGSTDAVVSFKVTDDEGGQSLDSATATRHVNLDGITLVDGTDGTADTNGCGYTANPCDTVQAGNDNARSGDELRIAASGGPYAAATIDRSLSIVGTGGSPSIASLTVTASNVTIDGVKLTAAPGLSVTGGRHGVVLSTSTLTGSGAPSVQVAAGGLDANDGLDLHNNRIVNGAPAVRNLDSHRVKAEDNWWGCNSGCDTTTGSVGPVDTSPRAVFSISVPVAAIKPGKTDTLTASLEKNSSGGSISPAIPNTVALYDEVGGPLGSFSPTTQSIDLSSGKGFTTWTSNGTPGTAHLRATLDSQALTSDVTVSASAPDGGAAVVSPPNNFFETDDVTNAASVGSGDPQDARITLPSGVSGIAGVTEQPAPGPYPSGYRWMGTGFAITADPDVPGTLTATFEVYLPGWPVSKIAVFRDGTRITATCTPQGTMSTAPCIDSVTAVGGGVFRIVVLTDHASFWTVGGPDPTVVMLTGPNVTTPQWTNDNTPTFTYKTQIGGVDIPDASVTYACDAGGVTTTCGAGTYTASSAIADGSRTMQVQAQVGGIAGPITSTSFFVDTVNPAPVRTSQPPAYTNSTTAAFTWTRPDASPSSGLTATDQCTLDLATASCGPASKTYTGLAEGNHTFTATVTDRAGNSGSTTPYTWMVDLTDPQTTLTGTLPGLDQDPGENPQGSLTFATHSTSASFTYTATDPLSGGPPQVASGIDRVECSLDGAAFSTGGCGPFTNLAHGVHTFRIRAIDNAGNVETVGPGQTWSWFVDRRPPDVVEVYPYSGGRFSYYKDVKAAYSCDDHIGPPFPSQSGVQTCLGQVPVGTPFDHTSQGQPADDHSCLTYGFSVTRTDKVGNTTSAPFNYCVYTFAGLVLDDNPEAYYRMDDPDNQDTLSDFSGNHHDGEYKNATMEGGLGVSGDGNTARQFTGADGYGFVNEMPAPTRGYTMAAFVQFDTADDGMIMQHGRAGALFRRGNDLVFMNVSEDEEVSLTVPGGIIPGCWYFVAGRFDHFHATIYAGTHDNATGPDCTPTTTDLEWFTPQTISTNLEPSGAGSTFYLGYGEEAPWLHGLLDEAAYFYTPISPTHIKELWLADPPPNVHPAVTHSYDAPSSTPPAQRPSVKPPATHPSAASARARAKAKVKLLQRRLAAAKAHLAHITRHHASAKQRRAARAAIAKVQRQLAAARRRL